MKYSQIYLVILITVGVAGFVIAAGAPVTHQFQGGDPASATQVNANFQELADRIDALPGSQIYDYSAYSGSATSKTFAVTGTISCGDTEIRSFSRVDNLNGTTTVTMTRDRQSSSVTCQHKTFEFLNSVTQKTLLSKANNNTSGVAQNTDTFNEGLLNLTSTMRVGVPFGSHSSITNDVNGEAGGVIETVTLLGVEDVVVPLGSYTGCLKIHVVRTSNNNGMFNRLSWRCPGVGEVKRVQHELTTGDYGRWELSSML